MLAKYHFGAWQDKTVPIFSVKSDWEPTEYIFPPLQKYFRHFSKISLIYTNNPQLTKLTYHKMKSRLLESLTRDKTRIYMISWYIQNSSPQPTTYQKHISNNEQFCANSKSTDFANYYSD